MAVPRIKYEMFADIRYDGRLVDVLDRIRAIRLVLMVHIEQDLGPNKELVKITAYKTGSKGKTPSLKFKYTDDGIYVLGNKSSMAYLARGYFHGINFPVCLSVCC